MARRLLTANDPAWLVCPKKRLVLHWMRQEQG
jgi:hypothetical protein